MLLYGVVRRRRTIVHTPYAAIWSCTTQTDKRTYAVCCYMELYDTDGQAYICRMLLYGVVRRRRTSVHTPYAAIWSCTTQTDKRTHTVCSYMELYDADGQAYIRRMLYLELYDADGQAYTRGMLLYGVVRRRRTSVHTPYAVIWSCTTQTDKRTHTVCSYMELYDADGQAYIRRMLYLELYDADGQAYTRRMLLYGVVRRRRTSVHTPYAVIWSCTTQISSFTD
ncbi:hypothetical protein DPMN_005996 [Dreissena polymorpha]|uniref:Uncharacterized protein n=1 Tax=Dreissena polymorpha TaxID=45954 RepID=A0A9D4MT75_DREPO|nr:hypothetical protein DPMN_005996 [Dreissena polymorpha]